ncbi:MAG TPA: hypothetical protein VKQ30_11280 [Ktedonobacterales bacterium]|jgi:hypothetical protein|nr:hypothetical protein [Ktedonobacterales bacterium]
MASSIQQRTKDHWSVRLRIKHPGTRNRTVLIVLVVLQALLLVLTASSIATGGGLYGCSGPCGTPAQPTTPAFAVLLGMIMLLLPIVIGFFSVTWQGAIGAAVVPWLPAILIGANALLAPVASVVSGDPITTKGHTSTPLVSHFGPPFWLDTTHVLVLFLSLIFFALLGWLGWVIGEALRDS